MIRSSDVYAILTSAGLDFSMHLMLDERQNAPDIQDQARLQAPINPGSKFLRRAIRKNVVSFPAQIPVFSKQPPDGMQWRMVILFFVRGWSLKDIAARFKVPTHRVCQTLNFWSVRALTLGYVQVIDPEAFAECCRIEVECETGRDSEEIRLEEGRYSPMSLLQQFPEATTAVLAPAALLSGGMRTGDGPNQAHGKSAEVIDALDAAIEHCEEWGDEFWMRTATLLRDLRAMAATALEHQRSIDQTDGRFPTLQGGKRNSKQELGVSVEEHISHAVA